MIEDFMLVVFLPSRRWQVDRFFFPPFLFFFSPSGKTARRGDGRPLEIVHFYRELNGAPFFLFPLHHELEEGEMSSISIPFSSGFRSPG